jgi:osmotically-inducible protein OsmY
MSANRDGRTVPIVTILAAALLVLAAASRPVDAQSQDAALMRRVEGALRADHRLNGAAAYTASPGIIVLYGKVFDEKDSQLAEQTASKVRGVKHVINTLQTTTGQWIEEQSRINDTLRLNGFQDVFAKVVGPEVYLSGQVNSEADKQRAVSVVSSISKLQVVDFIRMVPGPLLSTPNFF